LNFVVHRDNPIAHARASADPGHSNDQCNDFQRQPQANVGPDRRRRRRIRARGDRNTRRSGGYRVLGHAASVAEASAKCDQLDPDAVLLDVRLPDGDGLVLAKRLAARARRPRILLTSSDRTAVSPQSLHQSGANGFIPKTELAQSDLDQYLGVA
jgi:DNA-binding NarL/FixJ family response regulator